MCFALGMEKGHTLVLALSFYQHILVADCRYFVVLQFASATLGCGAAASLCIQRQLFLGKLSSNFRKVRERFVI